MFKSHFNDSMSDDLSYCTKCAKHYCRNLRILQIEPSGFPRYTAVPVLMQQKQQKLLNQNCIILPGH